MRRHVLCHWDRARLGKFLPVRVQCSATVAENLRKEKPQQSKLQRSCSEISEQPSLRSKTVSVLHVFVRPCWMSRSGCTAMSAWCLLSSRLHICYICTYCTRAECCLLLTLRNFPVQTSFNWRSWCCHGNISSQDLCVEDQSHIDVSITLILDKLILRNTEHGSFHLTTFHLNWSC